MTSNIHHPATSLFYLTRTTFTLWPQHTSKTLLPISTLWLQDTLPHSREKYFYSRLITLTSNSTSTQILKLEPMNAYSRSHQWYLWYDTPLSRNTIFSLPSSLPPSHFYTQLSSFSLEYFKSRIATAATALLLGGSLSAFTDLVMTTNLISDSNDLGGGLCAFSDSRWSWWRSIFNALTLSYLDEFYCKNHYSLTTSILALRSLLLSARNRQRTLFTNRTSLNFE
jgi:hypothetical protein